MNMQETKDHQQLAKCKTWLILHVSVEDQAFSWFGLKISIFPRHLYSTSISL
jgi:hypothetical protein